MHYVTCALSLFTLAGVGCVADLGADDVDTGSDVAEINGGVPVADGEFEAVGAVSTPMSFCSGTLITDTIVLTAAHCVCTGTFGNHTCQQQARFEMANVRPVDDPATREDESNTRTNVALDGFVVVHPDYEMGHDGANDMAVVRLLQPASTVALVSPIPISGAYPTVGTASSSSR